MINRLLVMLFSLSFGAGCGALDNCPDGQKEPTRITTGTTNTEEGTFESVPWSGPLDHFPAKSALVFEHGLGFTPLLVLPYLSFAPVGTHDADGGSVALTAGNQTLIDCVDSHVIVLRNDTCEESFYIRVTTIGEGEDLGDVCTKPKD